MVGDDDKMCGQKVMAKFVQGIHNGKTLPLSNTVIAFGFSEETASIVNGPVQLVPLTGLGKDNTYSCETSICVHVEDYFPIRGDKDRSLS